MGYVLTASLFYGLGAYQTSQKPPEIKIEEPTIDLTQLNNSLNIAGKQSGGETNSEGQVAGADTSDLNCEGKIKGNISSNSRIYHIPGGSFYKRTIPEACFDTEAEAQAAGFRKSQR